MRAYFLQKAEENRPTLYTRRLLPAKERVEMKMGDSVLLDLGEHAVGHFSFAFDCLDDFISAPLKLILRFGEDMREIEDDYGAYHGSLSSTWLQEEALLLDCPQKVVMPRRYSCRFVKITVENTRRPVVLSEFCFTAVTSADEAALLPCRTEDTRLAQIDKVACATLRDCMQSFFEDGPKRDRRLWIGDFRLEALTDYVTFQNLEIVRRCLYLFAAGEKGKLGFLPSYVYETPYFFSGRDHIADYALLYAVSVCDYFEHTGDEKTVRDLLDVCRDQFDAFQRLLDENGIVTPQEGWFAFIDWCPDLKRLTALQGVYLYALSRFADLLDALGEDSAPYRETLTRLRRASYEHLFDEKRGLFQSDGQVSVHSQVWMILGGAVEQNKAASILKRALACPDAKKPVTPYMWHYVLEAYLALGQKEEASTLIKEFWGGMLDRGADTFPEVYVPEDRDFSPYRDRKINSLCHAWSCTPSYFIRTYGL